MKELYLIWLGVEIIEEVQNKSQLIMTKGIQMKEELNNAESVGKPEKEKHKNRVMSEENERIENVKAVKLERGKKL